MDTFENAHPQQTSGVSAPLPVPPTAAPQPWFHWYDWVMGLLCLPSAYWIISGFFDGSWYFTIGYVLLFTLATCYLFTKFRRASADAAVLGGLAVLASGSFALHGDADVSLAAFLLLLLLSGVYCVLLTGENRYPLGSALFLADVVRTEVGFPFRFFLAPWGAALRSLQRKKQPRSGRQKTLWFVLGGVALAAVLLAVLIVPLLLRADAAFETLAGGLVDRIGAVAERLWFAVFGGEGLILVYVVMTLFVAPFLCAVLFRYRTGATVETGAKATTPADLQKAPTAFFAAFLGVIVLVYLIYLLTQLTYFFSGFTGALPNRSDFTLAEYARRGFFEMAEIAGVNLVLIASAALFSKRSSGRLPRAVKALCAVLCGVTLLFCAISVSKIALYIRGFGLTEKRVAVLAADAVLLLSFAAILVRLFVRRFPYFKVMLYAVCVAVTLLSVVGMNRLIATVNTKAYLSGTIQEIDLDHLSTLWIDGYEALRKIAASDADAAAKAAKKADRFAQDAFFRGDNNHLTSVDAVRFDRARRAYLNTLSDEQLLTTDAYVYLADNAADVLSIAVTCGDRETTGLENADGTPLTGDRIYAFAFETQTKVDADTVYHYEVTCQNGKSYSFESASNCVEVYAFDAAQAPDFQARDRFMTIRDVQALYPDTRMG